MEVHLEMNAIATDIIQKRTKFFDRNPTSHDGLASCQNLPIEVIPFGITSLGLSDTRCPLDSLEFLDLEKSRQMTHGSHTIEMIERVGNPLSLLANKWLHKTPIILDRKHRRDVALQFCNLAGSPEGEIAECHLIGSSERSTRTSGIQWPAAIASIETDNVIECIKHFEIGIVDALHLFLKQIGLRQGIHQHLVGAFHRCQHVKTFHQVGHADVIISP